MSAAGVIAGDDLDQEALALAREIRAQIPPGGPSISEILDEERAERI